MSFFKHKTLQATVLTGALLLTSAASATAASATPAASSHTGHNHQHQRADSHAPIGVMGDHTHAPGEWMLSYRYGRMNMSGNRSGTDELTAAQVRADFMVAPLSMDMEMHMFGIMYGVNERLTLMGMLPYVEKSMDHLGGMGTFTTRSKGIGDTKITGLYTLRNTQDANQVNTRVHATFGLSLPTGSITERDTTPMGPNQKLPYPMQLGSGTFDPILGLTYVQERPTWSFGGQVSTTIRMGKNNEGYRLGNEGKATLFAARPINDYASLSLRLEGSAWGNIHGQDNDLNPAMVPTARTDLRSGRRVDGFVGINLLQNEGALKDHRLALEYGLPLYQNLKGPQLEVDHRLMLGWQWAF